MPFVSAFKIQLFLLFGKLEQVLWISVEILLLKIAIFSLKNMQKYEK